MLRKKEVVIRRSPAGWSADRTVNRSVDLQARLGLHDLIVQAWLAVEFGDRISKLDRTIPLGRRETIRIFAARKT